MKGRHHGSSRRTSNRHGQPTCCWRLPLWLLSIGTATAFLIPRQPHHYHKVELNIVESCSWRRLRISQSKHSTYTKLYNDVTSIDTTNGEHVPSSSSVSPSSVSIDHTDKPPFTIETTYNGPNSGPVHTLRYHHIPGQQSNVPDIIIQVGKIGRQAAGAVTLSRGESVLLATAARDASPRDEVDFVPLSVEHQERFSSAGMTSGSYNRRDGRAAEHEILTCRLIDRPIRPLIASGWRHETQILSWVLSYDGNRTCDPLAILASATALYLSDVPLTKAIAAVQVGLSPDGVFLLNPTHEEMVTSRLHLIVAGTADAVLMIEGAADFLPESTFVEGVKVGHKAIQTLCAGIDAFGQHIGIVKKLDTIQHPPTGLQERVDELFTDRVDAMYGLHAKKKASGEVMESLQVAVVTELESEFPDNKLAIKAAFKDLLCRRMFKCVQRTGRRADGRATNHVRHLDMEAGLLPRVHGSALFTRGETQVLATATLGDSDMRQKIDKLDGLEEKRFYLQYAFPPSCVGETGRVGAPGRREVGHGNLAERALAPALPTEEEFPYTIRVESLITESHGSSSMASVCGGCLALMDAGVPIKKPVAGIAMGMLLDDKAAVSDSNAVILSDITGTEDALGTMDFKVAGDRDGVTTFQLDIKCEGLTLETMERALEQARLGRLHILDEMKKVLPEPRPHLPPTVPKILSFSVPPETIGKIIGPGGKQIRAVIEDFKLTNMDVNDDGRVQISSFNFEKMIEAKEFVLALIGGASAGPKSERPKYVGPEPVVGETYTGKITGIHPFGAFVEILPGAEDGSTPGLEGLVHVSELARERVRNCEAFLKSMNVDTLTVKYMGTEKGKIRLSRKAVLEELYGTMEKSNVKMSWEPKKSPDEPLVTNANMPDIELVVISNAIDEVKEL